MTVQGPTPADETDAIIGTLLKYAGYSDMKKLVALVAIVHKSTNEETVVYCVKSFSRMADVNEDGAIQLPEFW